MRSLLQDYLVVNSVGLGLDVIGVLLVFVCGMPELPARYDYVGPDRHDVWIYRALSRLGLGLLTLGFLLQLLSNAMQRQWFGLPWW